MAGLVGNQKEFVDRLTYRMYLPVDGDALFKADSGQWNAVGDIPRAWLSDNNGATDVTWTRQKPADWIRGETHVWLWIQGSKWVNPYTLNLNLQANVRLAPVGVDVMPPGGHIKLHESDEVFEISTGAPQNLLTRYPMTVIKDVSHGDDGLLFINIARRVDTADALLYMFGVELIHYPTLER